MGFDGHHHDPDALVSAEATMLEGIGAGRAEWTVFIIVRQGVATHGKQPDRSHLSSG
jgi:hypothetical protein